MVVRDHFPEQFLDLHFALFAARHDEGRQIKDPEVLRDVLWSAGIDDEAVFEIIDSGAPLDLVRKEHEHAAANHSVWGVPTFIAGDRAAFVRLMDRPAGDREHARRTVERVIDQLVGFPALNELKHTALDR